MTGIRIESDAVVGLIQHGMTIGIGGWGSRRKPMSLVRAIARSGARDLTIVSFGGPDVGMLCATGQVAKIVHGFVSLDSIAIDPHFAAARQAGLVETLELDEAMLVAGLRAAARRLPFEVTRSGLGSDAVLSQKGILTIRSPYDDREELVAMPAIPLDLALLHADRADEFGAAQCLGDDWHFDDLFAAAARMTVVAAQEIVPTAELLGNHHPLTLHLNRTVVHAVVAAPGSVGFTANPPLAERDEALQRAYVDAAGSAQSWAEFRSRFIDVGDAEYVSAVTAFHAAREDAR